MAMTRKEEERALSSDEHALVSKTRHPDLQALPDAELHSLAKLLRERREKAKTQAHQRRREIRGKASPKGQVASKSDEGSKLKVSILAMAVRRLNGEVELRRKMASRHSLAENAQRALEMKKQAETDKIPFNTRHADKGMRNIPNQRADSLIKPMERGRLKKAASVNQAKRDSKQAAAS